MKSFSFSQLKQVKNNKKYLVIYLIFNVIYTIKKSFYQKFQDEYHSFTSMTYSI